MCSVRYAFFVTALAVAFMCASAGSLLANPVDDAYNPTGNWWDCVKTNPNQSYYQVQDEHGGPSIWWKERSEDIALTYSIVNCGTSALKVDITNTTNTSLNPHTMWDTMLAFEQNAYDWRGLVLADNTWDGLDHKADGHTQDSAYYFDDIAPGQTSTRYIKLRDNYVLPTEGLLYDSAGVDRDLHENLGSPPEVPGTSNLSVTHVVPEPVSSVLFLTGAATLGFRQFRKMRKG